MVIQTGDNKFGVARWIVDPTLGLGTHTTIASALTSATSGETIFIRPGSYTENITLKAGVNLSAFEGDALTPTVTIIGNATMTTAGTVSISGIRLQTNSAAFLTVSGSAASIVNLDYCYFNCTNNTGIVFSTSSSSAAINPRNCKGNLETTGIAFFTHTSAGVLSIFDSWFLNSGGSTTQTTCSAGTLNIANTSFSSPITTSGTSAGTFQVLGVDTSAQGVTSFTAGGSGAHQFRFCAFLSGTATSFSSGSATPFLEFCSFNSTNTNAISGAGTVSYRALSFGGTSRTINTTGQTNVGTLQGSTTTQPTAGFLGERLSATASAVALVNGTPKTLTSVSITPGVWDISVNTSFVNSANTATAAVLGISVTTNTFEGVDGDQKATYLTSVGDIGISSLSVPAFRALVTATTTYYMVGQLNFTAGTGTGTGRISAVRVG